MEEIVSASLWPPADKFKLRPGIKMENTEKIEMSDITFLTSVICRHSDIKTYLTVQKNLSACRTRRGRSSGKQLSS